MSGERRLAQDLVAPCLVALAVLGGAACNRDPLPFPGLDGGAPDRATGDAPGGGQDGPDPVVDLAPPVCRAHAIGFVKLDDLQPVDGPGAQVGSSLRVRATYSLREGCDVAGDLDVRVMPGNATDSVVITLRLWRAEEGCGPPRQAHRIVTVGAADGLSNTRLLVSDGAPGGTRMLVVPVAVVAQPNCTFRAGIGQACEGDCQCVTSNAHARCLADGAGGFACGVACSEDADCYNTGAPGGLRCSPRALCEPCAGPPACGCTSDGDCPAGQVCQDGGCQPRIAQLGGSCSCDSDCGRGRLCSDQHACLSPCTTDADCDQNARTCDGGACR